MLVVDRLVGNTPPFVEEVVLVVVEERIGQYTGRRQGLETQQVHRAGVHVGGVPLIKQSSWRQRFGRHVGHPGTVA